ncbi:MAG: hypothetical protein B6242_14025 [Anaerolineaceae bacterium 4572_78]|nr:MAG: hypothetical protein B6242_14025 [Anaerolineaceae bacterium 4572_78]
MELVYGIILGVLFSMFVCGIAVLKMSQNKTKKEIQTTIKEINAQVTCLGHGGHFWEFDHVEPMEPMNPVRGVVVPRWQTYFYCFRCWWCGEKQRRHWENLTKEEQAKYKSVFSCEKSKKGK